MLDVIAGLDPQSILVGKALHARPPARTMDGRVKPGHDEEKHFEDLVTDERLLDRVPRHETVTAGFATPQVVQFAICREGRAFGRHE
jgi:hypothetical protein